MLNFRKLRQDFSATVLKEGKRLHEEGQVVAAKLIGLTAKSLRVAASVRGAYDHVYESEIEIDRSESEAIDSNCDCSYRYDCQHLAAVLCYLEENLDGLVAAFGREAGSEDTEVAATIRDAQDKEVARLSEEVKRQLLEETVAASQMLAQVPFFIPEEKLQEERAELAVVFNLPPAGANEGRPVEMQLVLRLPFRSKPLTVPNFRDFLLAVHNEEPQMLGNRRCLITYRSFEPVAATVLRAMLGRLRFDERQEEMAQRVATIEMGQFGALLAQAWDVEGGYRQADRTRPSCFYDRSLEAPLRLAPQPALIRFEVQLLELGSPKVFLKPFLIVDGAAIEPEQAWILTSAPPGLLYQGAYYRFNPSVRRTHLMHLLSVRSVAIPEPCVGTLVEQGLPELCRVAEVTHTELLEQFVTVPYGRPLQARCRLEYLEGELEAELTFIYDGIEVPAVDSQLTYEQCSKFVTPQGILARPLHQERQLIQELFQDFVVNNLDGKFVAKNEKKIVEFMTELVPRLKERVQFECPQNLLDQFVYDATTIKLTGCDTSRVDTYELALSVEGHLKGASVDLLWECIASNRRYVEWDRLKKNKGQTRSSKIVVLDLEMLSRMLMVLDELGVRTLEDQQLSRPLWTLVSLREEPLAGLPITLELSPKLQQLQAQMMGLNLPEAAPIPETVCATLRQYQLDGINWLDRLRGMFLGGILADDMGLGKTLQAIVALSQAKEMGNAGPSLVVCPTSLTYNWKEECTKFNSRLKVLLVDGSPQQRKKLIDKAGDYDVVITSYHLMQKDIEHYTGREFFYLILDEAQHIKNRTTRNAKSVKMIQAKHRLILTGTPIENSLEELWSLFDFLMPGLLGTFDRFVEKYVRAAPQSQPLEALRRKVGPFILRRMKVDVLQELPPVSQIVYHCQLSDLQQELYHAYAKSAREELQRLVEKEGFERVQIHVLATLTRLKQICCHPAIFAKEAAEIGDSAKYDLFLELLQNLAENGRKSVVFSQYARMLSIMRDDLEKMGMQFCYLDGSTKHRLDVVKRFNSDPKISVFLVSLKAGGAGLNLTGADTVIHYDLWWNPAVENQATDRVHRIGQKASVSAYKLVTLGSIEEKIVALQNRKRNLVTQVIQCDEEAVSKLTWEEVLELLQT
jgi:SNF2 family DNA or RNA helicase